MYRVRLVVGESFGYSIRRLWRQIPEIKYQKSAGSLEGFPSNSTTMNDAKHLRMVIVLSGCIRAIYIMDKRPT